jgi:hypothetical protein
MAGPAYVTDPTVLYLHQLLDELAKGYLQIPRFQRDFVWTDDQRLELLQSIRSGIPIGSILVWRTGITALKTVRRIGPHDLPEPAPSPTSARSYLLDGLQRLSTLFGCLRPLPLGGSPFVEDDDGTLTSWLVGFDLVTEQFQILDRGPEPGPTWLPLVRLLDSVRILQFQRGLSDRKDAEQLIQRADALAETFRTYKLPVVPVVTEDLATATRTFERVNRQGTPMSELHMVRALTWRTDFDLEEQLAAVRDQLAELGWESLEPEWILKVCKAALGIDIAVEAPDETSKRLVAQPRVVDEAARSTWRAARWLATHCAVLSPEIVPYRMQVVMLAEVMRLCPDPDVRMTRRLVQWFWRTTYTEGFSGITGGQTNAMLDSLRRVADGKSFESEERKAKEREPTFALPATFNPSWVRVKAIALRLAALTPLDLDGSDLGASKRLASEGPSALVPLLPTLRGSAARMFTKADSPLRDLLLAGAAIDEQVLGSHAITSEAYAALRLGDRSHFLELRGAEIRRLEEQFYERSQAALVE